MLALLRFFTCFLYGRKCLIRAVDGGAVVLPHHTVVVTAAAFACSIPKPFRYLVPGAVRGRGAGSSRGRRACAAKALRSVFLSCTYCERTLRDV